MTDEASVYCRNQQMCLGMGAQVLRYVHVVHMCLQAQGQLEQDFVVLLHP